MSSEESTEAKTAGPPPAIAPRGTVPRPPSKQASQGQKPKAKSKAKPKVHTTPDPQAASATELSSEDRAVRETTDVDQPAKSGSDKLRAWGEKAKANAEKTPEAPVSGGGSVSTSGPAPASTAKPAVSAARASIAPATPRKEGHSVPEYSGAHAPSSDEPVTEFDDRSAQNSQKSTVAPAVKSAGGARKVKLSIARIDPWSVMKLSFLLSIAIGIMIVVATWVFWYTLNNLGVFTSIDEMISGIAGPGAEVNILDYVARDRVLSLATLLAVVDVVLLTALSTIGAFLYNIVAALVGGIHLTMTDD